MSEKPNMRGNPKTQSSKPDPAPAPSPSPASTPSLATRIQSSATALAKSTLQPGSDLNNTLTSNNKSGPSASASIPTPSDNAPQLGSRSGSSASTGPRESFRTSNSTIPVPDEDFQQFQDEPRLDPGIFGDDYTDGRTEKEKKKGKARLESAWQDPNQINGQSAPASELQIHQNNLQTPEDGSAVLALLSTSFEEDPSTIPDTELDPAPLPLSAREREALDSYRVSSSGPRLTSSSLVPDIDTFLSQGYNEGLGSGVSGSALRDEVLGQLPGAGDWVGVQERYHDEVWGFLEPVLEAARVEIERGREGGGDGSVEGPAVRRLRMILGHMGG
ncbi:hypothetical protein N7452_009228 [Penicillium brevicompactum]|uniref:Uncharacterized protein n=1 Tax=Penicillium brevicompactum TaxID=5074 RepID=A0A9W9QB74_PENBR|nr:hypothetical protein N7452_009228 [Penicillium brevicompactum]